MCSDAIGMKVPENLSIGQARDQGSLEMALVGWALLEALHKMVWKEYG